MKLTEVSKEVSLLIPDYENYLVVWNYKGENFAEICKNVEGESLMYDQEDSTFLNWSLGEECQDVTYFVMEG